MANPELEIKALPLPDATPWLSRRSFIARWLGAPVTDIVIDTGSVQFQYPAEALSYELLMPGSFPSEDFGPESLFLSFSALFPDSMSRFVTFPVVFAWVVTHLIFVAYHGFGILKAVIIFKLLLFFISGGPLGVAGILMVLLASCLASAMFFQYVGLRAFLFCFDKSKAVVPRAILEKYFGDFVRMQHANPIAVADLSHSLGCTHRESALAFSVWTIDDDPAPLLSSIQSLWLLRPRVLWQQAIILTIVSLLVFLGQIFASGGRVLSVVRQFVLIQALFLVVISCMPTDTFLALSSMVNWAVAGPVSLLQFIFAPRRQHKSYVQALRSWANRQGSLFSLWFVLLALRLFKFLVAFEVIEARYGTRRSQKLTLRNVFNRTLLDIGRVVDALAIPKFVRGLALHWDTSGVLKSNAILAELGWPEAVRVEDGPGPQGANLPFNEWAAWHFAPAFGMKQVKFFVDNELTELFEMAPSYFRTEEYRSLLNEITSTSRYFTTVSYDFPDLPVDDVWLLVKAIFANSQVTPFRRIIRRWDKKFALGALYIDPSGKRKLSRKNFIRSIGGLEALVRLWERTFEVAAELITVNTVSVKGEALAPKKFLRDAVRTVVGAPLPHYITSTAWNYFQNHNFKPYSTPIKIGLPLNGANLSKIYAKHARNPRIWAGDMTAFDSTVSGRILDLVVAVRKKGFEHHKDADAIAYLIDKTYEQVSSSFLAHNSTGVGYFKGTGLSTGHSSTSMDNSLACVILYLMAWKELTGLTAREFKMFNELTVYGDDHFISCITTAPAIWTFDNIAKCMTRWGVTMRREDADVGIGGIEFLAKNARRPTANDVALFKSAGVDVPDFVIYHNKARLIGKATAKVRVLDVDYRIKRLLSYLTLTAHHEDVYNVLVKAIHSLKKRSNKKHNVPSYLDVVRLWYNPESLPVDFENFDSEREEGAVLDGDNLEGYHYGAVTVVDILANFLSHVPDVLNPAIFNQGYVVFFMSLLGQYLAWPIALLARQNFAYTRAHLTTLISRTAYNFLIDAEKAFNTQVDANTTTLLVRHWLFCMLRFPNSDSRYSLPWVDALLRKAAQLAFVATGEVQEEMKGFSFQFGNIVLITVLSFLHVPDIPFIPSFRLPNFSLIVNRLYNMAFNYFWSRVPTSFNELNASLSEDLAKGLPVLVVAPTATGKSTSLAYNLTVELPQYTRIVFIMPRAILVPSLAQYNNKTFGMGLGWATHETGLVESTSGHYVCTAAQVFIRGWHGPDVLWFLDEAHVSEPLYDVLLEYARQFAQPLVMATATPSRALLDYAGKVYRLPIARVFSITELPVITLDEALTTYSSAMRSYDGIVLDACRALMPSQRALIFVVDKAHAESLASRLPGRTCVLHSGSLVIDNTCRFFVSTSVADAGLTIPNVDLVMSTDVTRYVKHRPDATVLNVLVALQDGIITQRKGRTGRTTNGTFQLVRMGHLPFVGTAEPYSLEDTIFAASGQGIPFNVFTTAMPEGVLRLLYPSANLKYSRLHDELLDNIGTNFESFKEALGNAVTFDTPFEIKVGDEVYKSATFSMNRFGDYTLPAYSTASAYHVAALNLAARSAAKGRSVTLSLAKALLDYVKADGRDDPLGPLDRYSNADALQIQTDFIQARSGPVDRTRSEPQSAPFFIQDPCAALGDVHNIAPMIEEEDEGFSFGGTNDEFTFSYDAGPDDGGDFDITLNF